MRGIFGCAAALVVAASAQAAPRDPPRHYAAIGAPDPALVAAGALLGVSVGIEDADDAAIAALYRHQHAVTILLRDAAARRPVALGGAAFEPDAGRRGARLGVLRLPEGRAFAVTRAMEDSASTRAARLLLRPLPP
ncbi:hypothetical protein J5Y09_11775 [Roseomonas sp. PWR1]|uniref:DUF4154 domain-containing protein n=1 Tax=Roseomonas nitratireducens TaxID=2820810 RepID=A0ABS4ATG1_9PROT|nr:hypothetical protein [Neoroseomonas nitratireducens]MBP0464587.1 hypothetical protein [Neoroseomonas nitratireducens]